MKKEEEHTNEPDDISLLYLRTSYTMIIDAHAMYCVVTVLIHYVKHVMHLMVDHLLNILNTFVLKVKISFPTPYNKKNKRKQQMNSIKISINFKYIIFFGKNTTMLECFPSTIGCNSCK